MISKMLTNIKIFEVFQSTNYNLTSTAKILGISIKTLRKMISKRVELQDMVTESIEVRLDIAESELLKLIHGGNFNAIKFFLESQGGSRGYGDKVTQIDNNNVDEQRELTLALKRKYK